MRDFLLAAADAPRWHEVMLIAGVHDARCPASAVARMGLSALPFVEGEGKVDEGQKRHVERFLPCEDARQPLRPRNSRSILDSRLATLKVDVRLDIPVRLGRHDRSRRLVSKKPTGLAAFIGAVHRRQRLFDRLVQASQQGAAFGRVVDLPAGKAGNHCNSVTCGDQVELRLPSAARFADALEPVL